MAQNQNKKMRNSIKLTWNYYCQSDGVKFKKKTISERVYPGEEDFDSVIACLADLVYVRRVKLDYYQGREIQWGDMIEETMEFISSEIIPLRMARRFDYIMLQIIAMVAFRTKEYAIQKMSDANNNLNTILDIQGEVNKICRTVSSLYRLVTVESFDQSQKANYIWNKLLEEAQKILSVIKNEKGETLSELRDYISQTRKRCIGLYVFDDYSIIPLVSFSGYLDCTDEVKKLIGRKKTINSRTLKAFNDVCTAMGAKLVRSNPCVKRYFYQSPLLIEPMCLKEAVSKNGNKRVGNYSCCERKIFTKFGGKDGSLFTTRYACQECQNAYDYYVKQMNMYVDQPNYEFVTIFRKNH